MDWSRQPYLEQVRGDTYCIVTPFVRIPLFRLDRTHAVLMNSGLHWNQEGICRVLDQEGIQLRAILTSHAHIDHTGNHRFLQERYGAVLCMSPFDAAISCNPLGMTAYLCGGTYEGTKAYAQSMFCRADRLLDRKRGRVEIDGASFRLLELDGHAPEHLGFVTPDGVAYLGDTLMSRDVLEQVRIPYCTSCQVDLESKRRAAGLSFPCYVLAHNGVCDTIQDLVRQNVDSLLSKIQAVADQADRYRTEADLIWASQTALGAQAHTVEKVRTAEQNLRSYIGYLTDNGVLTARVRDGRLEYIRTELA